jgi:hypothetical protein
MKILLLLLLGLVALVVLVALVGALLPRDHVATRAAVFRQTPAVLFATIRDFAAQPGWRTDIKSIELLPPDHGAVSFRETSRQGAVTYRIVEELSGEKLVLEIADEALPYGGRWIFALRPVASGTELRITENGFVKNVIFRCLARFVFGYTATMESYLRDLGKKFGEPVTPAP